MDLGMKNIDSLSITEKISLYNCLYKDLAGKGIDGDTELAHVNKEEMEVLRSMGGSGTINPHTNLIQYKGGSRGGGTQTVRQEASFPKELQPFIKDIFGKAKAIQEQEQKEGYIPFPGQRLADFTQDQLTAFQGVRDTVGSGDPYFTRSEELFESSTAAPTAESVGQFMNPYIQNVLDIERREARRDAERVGQGIAGRAARAGGFGGSREAILAAENERNTQRNLADIQSRGLASAFEDAQSRLAQQRGRELAAGQQFVNLGTTIPAQRLRELGALEATGATQQQRGQQAIDIAQQEFELDKTHDKRVLGDYSAILRGFTAPLQGSFTQQTSTRTPGPSFGQQAAGIAGLVGTAGRAGFFGNRGGQGFNFNSGGLVGMANGGKVRRYQTGSGLDTIGRSTTGHSQGQALIDAEITRRAKAERRADTQKENAIKKALADKQTKLGEDLAGIKPFSYGGQRAADFQKLLAGHEAISKSRKGMLDTKRKLLQKQIADAEGAGQDELYAGLLRYASADPVKGIQGLFEAFEESPENLKAAEQRAADLALTEAGLTLEGKEAAASDIQKRIVLSNTITEAVAKGQLSITDAVKVKAFVDNQGTPDQARKMGITHPKILKAIEEYYGDRTEGDTKKGTVAPNPAKAAASVPDVKPIKQ